MNHMHVVHGKPLRAVRRESASSLVACFLAAARSAFLSEMDPPARTAIAGWNFDLCAEVSACIL